MELNYQIDGPDDAPVVVLSNSLGTTLAMWAPQLAALSAQYRVLRYDTHGHGATNNMGPTDLARLGQDVIALLDHWISRQRIFAGSQWEDSPGCGWPVISRNEC